MDITHIREEYTKSGLSRENLEDNPYNQFDHWFIQAQKAKLTEPNAMSLATATANGIPGLRTVLLKHIDTNGLVFFTNYSSNKANDITENSQVALLFPWISLERQVIVRGYADKISEKESIHYFNSRPYGSQLGAWVSHQSSVIANKKLLEIKLDEMKHKFSEGTVPPPSFWGGYRVIPKYIEFWQGRPNRLHDRFLYSRENYNTNEWKIERLAP